MREIVTAAGPERNPEPDRAGHSAALAGSGWG